MRSARDAAGLDQRALAKRCNSSQSQISLIEGGKQSPSFDNVARVLRGAGRRLIAVGVVRDDAATIAGEITAALDADNAARASRLFIQLNDNLAAEHGADRFVLAIAEPRPTGSKRWDAAIAALVAHWLVREGLPVPDWATAQSRTLQRAWVLADARVRPQRENVPAEFLRRGVLVDRDTLVSA